MSDADRMAEMQRLLAEIERVLPTVTWKPELKFAEATDNTIAARGFTGEAEGWTFVITSFSIEPQGFPPGSRGWDGVGRKGNVLIRFTRELAEKAIKLAEIGGDA